MKKIAVGDLGEFWYGDYKEPFEQLEGGVPGHPVGVVLKADDGKLLCAWCGKTYDNLGRHVSATHKMSSREYKSEVGLLQKSALVSEAGRHQRSARALRLHAAGVLSLPGRWEKGKRRPNQAGRRNGTWTPEALNKTGRCYEQTLAVARSIANSGKRVTQSSMGKYGIRDGTVLAYFGSWDELRRRVGETGVLRRKWTDDALLSAFRSLAQQLGRTPTQSDLNRFGLPYASYYRHFGSLTKTAELAGLPSNLPTPHDDEWAVRMLTAYAIVGRTDRVADMLGTTHKAIGQLFARYGCPVPMNAKGSALRMRREWAAMMARRLAGMPDEVAA